jgi:hypothetical protein
MIAALTSVLPNILGIIDKSLPDAGQAALAKQKIELELITAANEINKAQAETNKVEAGHRSIWVAGWRPAIGWTCSIGVFWAFVGHPTAQWAAMMFGIPFALLPTLPTDMLFELVMAMLGLAGLRTFDKMKGVSK